MKKLVILMLVLLVAASLPLQAVENNREFNVTGGLGFAFSDFEGLFLDLGLEYQIRKCIYIQALLDYYFNPSGASGKGINDSAWGINAYAVYKKPLKGQWTLFGKAGIHLTSYKVSAEYMGFRMSDSSSDLGIGIGAGVEYRLKAALALVAGLTFKTLFSDETGTWFKLYGGVKYFLKK